MTTMRIADSTLVMFWDYDTQWGADRSRLSNGKATWGHLEFENTERVLEAHARYDVPACFAVVGAAALDGERPYHDPEQIRRIHGAGHEVASHSFHHEWLPAVGIRGLETTVRESRDALEQCIGARVITFVPPFNQPFDYWRAASISLSERRSVPQDRIDIPRLCTTLREAGYQVCRTAFRSALLRVRDRITAESHRAPGMPRSISGILCLQLNTTCGFRDDVLDAMRANLGKPGLWVVYGHPHSISDPDSTQSQSNLEHFLATVSEWKRAGRLHCALPRDLVGAAVPTVVEG